MAHIWWAEILQQVIINLIRPKVEKESRKGKVKCTRVKSILIQRRRIDQTTVQNDVWHRRIHHTVHNTSEKHCTQGKRASPCERLQAVCFDHGGYQRKVHNGNH